MDHFVLSYTDSIFFRIVDAVVESGRSLGCAYPSSHVVGAVTTGLLAARHFGRAAATIYVVEVLGVVTSTVYNQYHYFIDPPVGVLAAILAYFLVVPGLRRLLGDRRKLRLA